jgi:hypothetical protein
MNLCWENNEKYKDLCTLMFVIASLILVKVSMKPSVMGHACNPSHSKRWSFKTNPGGKKKLA